MSKEMRELINKIKNFGQFINENLVVGGIEISNQFYDNLYDDNYGADEDELKNQLSILDKYQKNGGEIHRVIFSNQKPNIENIGYSWTHKDNDWRNYKQSIIDFNDSMGKLNGDENIWLIKAITPPNNVAVISSLEQFQNNPEEQEITILNDKILKILDISQV